MQWAQKLFFHFQSKRVTCKKAEAKQGKIYLGRLPADLTKEDIEVCKGTASELQLNPFLPDCKATFPGFFTFFYAKHSSKIINLGARNCPVGRNEVSIPSVTPSYVSRLTFISCRPTLPSTGRSWRWWGLRTRQRAPPSPSGSSLLAGRRRPGRWSSR